MRKGMILIIGGDGCDGKKERKKEKEKEDVYLCKLHIWTCASENLYFSL
jgi:hypothetical protein